MIGQSANLSCSFVSTFFCTCYRFFIICYDIWLLLSAGVDHHSWVRGMGYEMLGSLHHWCASLSPSSIQGPPTPPSSQSPSLLYSSEYIRNNTTSVKLMKKIDFFGPRFKFCFEHRTKHMQSACISNSTSSSSRIPSDFLNSLHALSCLETTCSRRRIGGKVMVLVPGLKETPPFRPTPFRPFFLDPFRLFFFRIWEFSVIFLESN